MILEKIRKVGKYFFSGLIRHVLFECICFSYKLMSIVILTILSTCDCNLCSCLANLTQQRILEWPFLHIFSFVLILLSNENSTKEWAWIYVWPTEKKGLELFLCVRCKLCLFCMLSVKDISECQLLIKGCYFCLPKNTWESGCAGQLTQSFSSF